MINRYIVLILLTYLTRLSLGIADRNFLTLGNDEN